jgi:aspartokinase/homoserine dehydrogenase 1
MKVLSVAEQALTEASSIESLARIVRERAASGSSGGRAVVAVSALAGVGQALSEAAKLAEEGSSGYQDRIAAIRERCLVLIRDLFPAREQSGVITEVQILLGDLEDILHGVQLIRECSPRSRDLLLSFGVRISCILISRALKRLGCQVEVVDQAGVVLKSNRPGLGAGLGHGLGHGLPEIDYPASYESLRRRLGPITAVAVVGGGLAATPDGATVVLKHEGTDLSACLAAAALQAELVELWTDLEGVMSANPAYVPEAFVIPALSYQEAMELSYFGARLVHPRALVPVMEADIPIQICSLNRPALPGTRICRDPQRPQSAVVGIASVEPVALVNIEGGGMIGVPGIAARIFATLAGAAVNIMMISQASSEHSICVVFRQEEAARALEALQAELAPEIRAKQIQNFDLRQDLAILAVIGDNMRGTPGISGKLFSSLGEKGINILAIAQGSSESNISFVIEKGSEAEALETVHRAFLGRGG